MLSLTCDFIVIQHQGPIGTANLYSPEAQLLTSPLIVSFLNGIVSLFENGLTRYSRWYIVNLVIRGDAQAARKHAMLNAIAFNFLDSDPLL